MQRLMATVLPMTSIIEVRNKFNGLVDHYKLSIKEEAKKVIEAGGLFVIRHRKA